MARFFQRLLRTNHFKVMTGLLLVVTLASIAFFQFELLQAYPGRASQEEPFTCQSTRPSDSNPAYMTTYIKRRLLAESVCLGVRPAGGISYVTQYGNTTSDSMVSYCGIPKVACSFWLAVFRFVTNDTSGIKYSSPYDISRSAIHYADYKTMQFHQNLSLVADDFRFMFVREPYGRLWSSYIDKFFLPDFWFSHGVNVINYRNKHTSGPPKSTTCPNDISFQDFVKYVVDTNPWGMNTHWRPMHLQCNPCLYRPHLIGKLETFPQDARAVLNCMGASWIMDIYNHKKHVESEILDLIDFNFMIAKRKQTKDCVSVEDIARRLWMSFKINGFIPEEVPVPTLPKGATMNHTMFQGLALKALREGPKKTKADLRQQKRKAMLDAYSTLPKDVMLAIQDLFWDDFNLFGYDPEPPDLYSRFKTVASS